MGMKRAVPIARVRAARSLRSIGLQKSVSKTAATRRPTHPSFIDQVAICYFIDMSQPVKLSDGLVLDARMAAAVMERSIAGQVEFWARLGRALEEVTTGQQMASLQQAALPLSEIVETVNKPAGRKRLANYLNSRPFPRFSPHPKLANTFVREDANGEKTVGRFKRGVFQAIAKQRKTAA